MATMHAVHIKIGSFIAIARVSVAGNVLGFSGGLMGQNDRRTEFYLIGENQLNYVKQNFKHPWAT